ncbi:MAG TPA: cupredoxin domain-containing protein [Ktedonobacteraceae bacterium]|nr:cupredoxin domain-containing protein [Ktedonobacteraceae bacterium]
MQQQTLFGHVVQLFFLLLIAGMIVTACGAGSNSATTALSSPTTASNPTSINGATPAITGTTTPALPSPTTSRTTATPTQKASAPFPTPTKTPHPPTPTPKPSPSPTAPPPTTVEVSITFDSSGSFTFSPAALTIQPNTTIVWKNRTQTPHTVSSDNGTSFNSGTLAPGGSFSFTFKQAGNFAYHCQFHPYMTASITVS